MAYEKTVWKNGQSPAINATNLNKIEKGIDDAHTLMAESAQNLENHIGEGGTVHALATTSMHGFMSKEDKTALGNKVDKPASAVANNIAIFNSSKNVVDSGKKVSDFQSFNKTTGNTSFSDAINVGASLTKNIPIPSGMKEGKMVICNSSLDADALGQRGILISFGTNKSDAMATGSSFWENYGYGGAISRRIASFITSSNDRYFGANVAGEGNQILDTWINGNNISITFKNFSTGSRNLKCHVAWEVW